MVPLDVPEEDLVIAAVVAIDDAALEVRCSAAEKGNAVLAERVVDAGELVARSAGEADGEVAMLRTEDVDAEVRRGAEGRQARRCARERPQHERRVERDGAEGVAGEAEEPARFVARGDDGDARREGAQRVAEVAVVEGRGAGLVFRCEGPPRGLFIYR